jgi:hypothetical protein
MKITDFLILYFREILKIRTWWPSEIFLFCDVNYFYFSEVNSCFEIFQQSLFSVSRMRTIGRPFGNSFALNYHIVTIPVSNHSANENKIRHVQTLLWDLLSLWLRLMNGMYDTHVNKEIRVLELLTHIPFDVLLLEQTQTIS